MTRASMVALATLVAIGCGGARLKGEVGAVDSLIATARGSGAVRCAPVELAMAESHVDFAKQDLAEGRYHRAKTELAVAQSNAREAVRKSPKHLCAPEKPKKAPPPPAKDSDGDGLHDDIDACPKAPEDKDGFEDKDGCPDDDNDSDGIADVDDECPLEAEDKDAFEDDDGCPDSDNDGDGLADVDDKCPLAAEDKDGFEDDDGCPDDDNDSDGVADASDECPLEAEDKDGFEDGDGCPDCDNDGDGVPECPQVVDKCPHAAAKTADGCPEYKLVKITAKKIEIKQTVYFATRKATIKRKSYALLNEVVQALADNPKLRVRVEGHTDSRGSDKFNMRLSQARAESVHTYLVNHGIDSARLEANGYGETMPIADNRTSAGRAQNRRVEFVIIER